MPITRCPAIPKLAWRLLLGALALLSFCTAAPLPSLLTVQDGRYDLRRKQLVCLDSALRFDRAIELSEAEKQVDAFLEGLRSVEGTTLKALNQFPPALRFPQAKPIIESTKLFSVLKDMPKGGYLHGHLEAMIDIKWMVRKAAEDIGNCYLKFVDKPTRNASVQLPLFNFSSTPLPRDTWVACSEARTKYPGGPKAFDEFVELQNSVIADQYSTEELAWAKFETVFDMLGSLLHYRPMYEAYIKQLLEQYYLDGISYIELRTFPWFTYDANGGLQNFRDVLDNVRSIVNEFKGKRPDFQDLKFIYQDLRSNSKATIATSLRDAISLRKTHSSQIVGYDLVGHEEMQHLAAITDLLVEAKRIAADAGVELPYMFHAGETLRSGPAPDANLLDAFLLGAKRVGHGISLSHHQHLIEKFIEKGIALEVAPISNQLLGYVSDLREHPLIDLLMRGVQVSLASDDPAVFGYEGVTYDYFQVYISFENLNLASLKTFALNGMVHAGMSREEKDEALTHFERRWNTWISSVRESL